MSARTNSLASARPRRSGRFTPRWRSLFGEYLGKKKVWKCTFCGVVGSHRRGCHYVTEGHHRGPKAVRRGILGVRGRTARARSRAARTERPARAKSRAARTGRPARAKAPVVTA